MDYWGKDKGEKRDVKTKTETTVGVILDHGETTRHETTGLTTEINVFHTITIHRAVVYPLVFYAVVPKTEPRPKTHRPYVYPSDETDTRVVK